MLKGRSRASLIVAFVLSVAFASAATAQTIVVDNGTAGFSTGGAWLASTSTPGYYGSNYLHDGSAGIDAGKWAKWRPTFPSTGSYTVYARWTSHSNRANNVRYRISHQGVVTDVFRNQQTGGGTWVSLGTYTFGAGSSESNRVTIDAGSDDGYVVADAVQFVGGACGSCGGGLPARVVTGYWHNFNNGSTTMKLNAIPSRYNLIAVAFADANPAAGSGAVSFNLDPATGYSGTSEFISHINQLNSANRPVILSVGGQNGTVSVADSGSATRFANSVVALMNQYGFKGVDIDLENGLNATYMTQALNSIRSQRPGAILTMAPQTIDMQNPNNEYFKTARSANVDLVNMQYYNSGCMLGCNQTVCYSQGTLQFLTMLACIQVQHGLRGDQIGFGVPASTAAAGGGFYSTGTVNAAMNCFAGNNAACGSPIPPYRARVRGAMTWSINWDAVQGYSWVNGITVP
jgi:chitinase